MTATLLLKIGIPVAVVCGIVLGGWLGLRR